MPSIQLSPSNMFPEHDPKIKSNFPENTNKTDENKYDILYTVIPFSIRFALLLTFEIPSIMGYIFVIGYILSKKSLRLAPNNYVMLIILFISFIIVTIDIPWELYYYRWHTMPIKSSTFCLIWWFIDLYSFCTCQILVAWASFERHILIFHDRLLNQKWKKICFHYMPPFILIIYMMTFYIYVLFVIPCEDSVIFDNDTCTVPCYLGKPMLGLWESIFHSLVTTIFIFVFSCALLIRVYLLKTRLKQSVNWRKYRKMMFQLISISSLYLSTNIPYFIIYIFYMTGFYDRAPTVLECLSFIGYFIPLFLPFICLTSLPKISTKLKSVKCCRIKRRTQSLPLHALAKNNGIANVQT